MAVSRRGAWMVVRASAIVTVGLALAWPARAIVPELTDPEVENAVDVGTKAMVQEDFGEEWHLRLPDGEEITVSTPFSRLALAARQAALKGEPLTDKQRQDQIDRGKGRIQFMITMFGRQPDFARWYQAVLRVGDREIKATFNQNERSPLRTPDGRLAARNIYVFPLEGVPPTGTVTLVVRNQPDQKEVLRAAVDLAKMR